VGWGGVGWVGVGPISSPGIGGVAGELSGVVWGGVVVGVGVGVVLKWDPLALLKLGAWQ